MDILQRLVLAKKFLAFARNFMGKLAVTAADDDLVKPTTHRGSDKGPVRPAIRLPIEWASAMQKMQRVFMNNLRVKATLHSASGTSHYIHLSIPEYREPNSTYNERYVLNAIRDRLLKSNPWEPLATSVGVDFAAFASESSLGAKGQGMKIPFKISEEEASGLPPTTWENFLSVLYRISKDVIGTGAPIELMPEEDAADETPSDDSSQDSGDPLNIFRHESRELTDSTEKELLREQDPAKRKKIFDNWERQLLSILEDSAADAPKFTAEDEALTNRILKLVTEDELSHYIETNSSKSKNLEKMWELKGNLIKPPVNIARLATEYAYLKLVQLCLAIPDSKTTLKRAGIADSDRRALISTLAKIGMSLPKKGSQGKQTSLSPAESFKRSFEVNRKELLELVDRPSRKVSDPNVLTKEELDDDSLLDPIVDYMDNALRSKFPFEAEDGSPSKMVPVKVGNDTVYLPPKAPPWKGTKQDDDKWIALLEKMAGSPGNTLRTTITLLKELIAEMQDDVGKLDVAITKERERRLAKKTPNPKFSILQEEKRKQFLNHHIRLAREYTLKLLKDRIAVKPKESTKTPAPAGLKSS